MESTESRAERIVAIVGRPNVGKSALFNRLVRRRLAIVHSEEGVTRDRLMARAEWLGQRFQVVDTGGLALMDRAKSTDEMPRKGSGIGAQANIVAGGEGIAHPARAIASISTSRRCR